VKRYGQLVMPTVDDQWVVVTDHAIIPAGTRYLVKEDRGDGWMLCWRDGMKPVHAGSLLHEKHVKEA